MTRSVLLTSAAIAAFATTGALAQEAYDLEQITVTANQNATSVEQSGATVEIIGQDTLTVEGTAKLADALQRLPGLSYSSNGGLGASTTLKIRGNGAGYIATYLNGIDMSDPASSGNGYDFGNLAAIGINRVEVLKGSQSARFGQGAIAGVIDMSTWTPEVDGASGQMTVEAGSYNTNAFGLNVGNRGEDGYVAFGLTRLSTDGFSTKADNTEADGFENTRLTLTGEYQLTDAVNVGVSLIHDENYGEYDDAGWFGTDPVDDDFGDGAKTGGRLFAQFDTGLVSHELSVSGSRTVRNDTGYIAYFRGERTKLAYSGATPLAFGDLSFGAEKLTETNLQNDSYGGSTNDEMSSTAVFAEFDMSLGNSVDVVTTLRRDDPSKYDPQNSGRVAISYRPTEDLIIRAQAGTGFRAPSLTQLSAYYASEEFGPEQSKNYEIGAEYRLGGNDFIRATAFYMDIENQIAWDPSATNCAYGAGCYVTQSFVSKGLELSGSYELNDMFAVSAAYTYTDAQDTNGDQIARLPKHDLVVGVDADLTDRIWGSLNVRHAADVTPSAYAPAGHKVGDFTVVNVDATYAVTDTVEAYARVENLFDEDYETAGGYNTSGRAVYVGFRADF
ncbi:hypothetical protein BVC71_08850 [Marivivens niveibacter]|uniref:TonB-dependent receptor n=1 Tax=Marivivens niveibacter TaxID=1930667 RepID=A0A251WWG3_9RHOB|nr:TonB-dependent receptor [Marivivens niveibacter]OUD08820.1 hypothetical protein BVC71_08850 [Marivivens niveibacter]